MVEICPSLVRKDNLGWVEWGRCNGYPLELPTLSWVGQCVEDLDRVTMERYVEIRRKSYDRLLKTASYHNFRTILGKQHPTALSWKTL